MTWGSYAQVWFLQRRFHKDILLNPVLVLSFCPDLSSKPGHLGTATRELLFLLDGSSVAHKACGGEARVGLGAGRGAVGLRVAEGSLSKIHAHMHTHTPTHTHSYRCVSPGFQEPLSPVKLHSVTPIPNPRIHNPLQGFPQTSPPS